MSCKRISDINPEDKPNPLEVRVIKKWKPHSKKADLCYLLVDIHGDAIEAAADSNEEEYFDSIIKIQSCHILKCYLSIPSVTYKAVVPHTASIRIGKRASFIPLLHKKIPTYHYNFATYDELENRKRNQKLLTDYIGRVEKVRTEETKTRKILTKISLQDEGKHMMEFTLWDKNTFEVESSTALGQVLAITSTMVTKYQVMELQQTKFACLASVIDIFNYRKWYYALCFDFTKKLYPEQEDLVCEDQGTINSPKYMYCVNATIADNTSSASVVFFNDAMSAILNIDCHDMVINHGHKNPKVMPPMLSIKGIPKLMQITVKPDGTIAVNRVFEDDIANSTSSQKGTASQPTPPFAKQAKKRPYLPQGTTNQEPAKRKTKN